MPRGGRLRDRLLSMSARHLAVNSDASMVRVASAVAFPSVMSVPQKRTWKRGLAVDELVPRAPA